MGELSPQNAAEQFRRVNKTLPDGVHYEPLDEETMKILRGKLPAQSKEQPQIFGTQTPMIPLQQPLQNPMQPSEPSASKPLPTEASGVLEALAQNERNAYVFYSHFAANEELFAILAKDSKKRLEQYTTLLSKFFKRIFVAQETDINKELSISEAVALAISEENKGLITLVNLSELFADTEAENQILRVVNQKLIGQCLLMSVKPK